MNNLETKTIVVMVNGERVKKQMTIEDAFVSYQDMIKKFANDCVKKTYTMKDSINDFDDYCSIGYQKLNECFEKYEPTFAFSCFLQAGLDLKRKELIRNLHRQKRKPIRDLVSFDCEINDEFMLADIEGGEDTSLDFMMYKSDLNDAFEELTFEEKAILQYLVYGGINKINLAKLLNITRPTLDRRIEALQNKFKKKFPEYFNIA